MEKLKKILIIIAAITLFSSVVLFAACNSNGGANDNYNNNGGNKNDNNNDNGNGNNDNGNGNNDNGNGNNNGSNYTFNTDAAVAALKEAGFIIADVTFLGSRAIMASRPPSSTANIWDHTNSASPDMMAQQSYLIANQEKEAVIVRRGDIVISASSQVIMDIMLNAYNGSLKPATNPKEAFEQAEGWKAVAVELCYKDIEEGILEMLEATHKIHGFVDVIKFTTRLQADDFVAMVLQKSQAAYLNIAQFESWVAIACSPAGLLVLGW